jgi:hypothetical protein
MSPERPPEPPGETFDQAGSSQPRRRRLAKGETQSAGHARRSHLSRDCGRGFNSRRLHWFARDRQSGICLTWSFAAESCATCATRAAGSFRRPSPIELQASRRSTRPARSRVSRSASCARDQDTLASVTIAKARAHAAVTLVCRPSRARAREQCRCPLLKAAGVLQLTSLIGRCSDSSDSAASGRAKLCARTAPLPRSRSLPYGTRRCPWRAPGAVRHAPDRLGQRKSGGVSFGDPWVRTLDARLPGVRDLPRSLALRQDPAWQGR